MCVWGEGVGSLDVNTRRKHQQAFIFYHLTQLGVKSQLCFTANARLVPYPSAAAAAVKNLLRPHFKNRNTGLRCNLLAVSAPATSKDPW